MSLIQVCLSTSKKTQQTERAKIREPKKKELTTVEAFAPDDCSAGFGTFPQQNGDLIDGGDVRVNWKDTASQVKSAT